MQHHIAFGGRGARRGESVKAGEKCAHEVVHSRLRFQMIAALATLFAVAAGAQQTPGKSVYAISEEQVKQEKAQKKEERKEQKAEQKAQKKADKATGETTDSPEPPPAPVVGQSPPLESAQTNSPEEETEPATVEGTEPPQPRVESQMRPEQPSGAVMDPPPASREGVLEEAPQPPEVPVNTNRPKDLQPVEGKFFIDFEKRPLVDVIAAIGPMVGKNFLLDPTITNQEVTLITHAAIPPDMVLEIFESVLTTYGFKLVDTADGNLTKIVPIAEGKDQSQMIISDQPPTGFEGYIFQVVQVKHAAASEVSQLLTEVGSKEAKVTVYERTNMLLLYGTEASIRKMMQLIEEVDQAGFEEDVEFFVLEFTRADVVSQQIQQVLMGDETQGGGGGAQPAPGQPVVRQPTPVVRPSRPGAPSGGAAATQQVIGTQALTLRITPDERLNALIVVASRPLMVRVRDLIEKLDSPTPPDSNNMHVRELQFADAEFVQEALQSLISGGSGSGGLRSSAASRSRTSGIGTGTRSGGSQSSNASAGSPGTATGGGGPGADIQPFEKSVTVTAYLQTNSLLIIASPQDYKLLDTIITQIDKPARQVLVEGIIMEVGIGDEFRLAVESAGLTDNDYFALNNVVSLANVLTQGPLASLDGGGILNFGIIDGTTNIQVPNAEGGGSTVQEVNNVPFLLQALESITALDVLSRPSVITVDNEEANVLDGQNIPIPTGSERNLGTGGTQGSTVFTSTDRENVGVIMNVTPQISEGDYVYLDLDIEVSRPIQSTVGIDPNATGVTLAKSNIITKAVVRDGSTGVLGGLLSESTDRARRQTPILGDIPGLGWLFGNKNYSRNKRNLVVLITPHIVKEGIDYDRLTQAQMNKAAAANADVFFDRGIIKKIGKKAQLRSKYRPTDAAMNDVRGITNDLTPTPESLDRGVAPEAQ
ncbi:MAG: type II secretion system secretin GspD [Candidatus Hydrogenedentes bacterium]|nr:type II secretion system secretin GspD [Candidatus Hydrogenedentota bacterium]